jgi:hypothetical protein
MRRILKIKIFLGSTTEEIQTKVDEFLGSFICVGNYIDFQLYKLGNVYQGVLIYAELVNEL